MHCIEEADRRRVRARRLKGLALAGTAIAVTVAGCGGIPGFGGSAPAPAPAPVSVARPSPAPSPAVPAPAAATRPAPAPAPMVAARNWDEYRRHAAQRIVAANPGATYDGRPPEPLLAIPVLEIELNGDGSIRRIEVMRHPSQARDTTQLAIDAVRRAAPFGDVSRLPRPWKFSEVFLFDDNRRFKPRTLDQ